MALDQIRTIAVCLKSYKLRSRLPPTPAFPVILKQLGYPVQHFAVIFVELPDGLDQIDDFGAKYITLP
ncbi:hypothetical protein FACS189485_06880 [Spirochaetia bacterium]|nr:hypothetical protein FACS189485_06880 [Spirochaetia bacterium]